MTVSVGLVVGATDVPAWFASAVERVESETQATVDVVVTPEEPTADPPDKGLAFYARDVAEKGCWAPVAAAQKVGETLVGPIPELRREPLGDVVGVEPVSCGLARPSTYRYALPDSAVERLGGTDVTFHWGVGILTGAVLDAPTDGVWGVHHGNVRAYRGGPPGFWEYLHGADQTAVTLQRFSEELDAGTVVVERAVDIDDARTWRGVRRRQCRATVPVLAEGIERFVDESDPGVEVDDPGPVYRPSDRTCVTTVRYLARAVPGWGRTLLG